MSNNVIPIPLYIKHNLSMRSHDFGRLDVSVGPKQTLGRTIEGNFQKKNGRWLTFIFRLDESHRG